MKVEFPTVRIWKAGQSGGVLVSSVLGTVCVTPDQSLVHTCDVSDAMVIEIVELLRRRVYQYDVTERKLCFRVHFTGVSKSSKWQEIEKDMFSFCSVNNTTL